MSERLLELWILEIPIGENEQLYLLKFVVLRNPTGENEQLYLLIFVVLQISTGENKPTIPIDIYGIADSNR